MACPFFMPTQELSDGGWLHPARLPLGGGWRGQCCAPGHEGAEPSVDELRQMCNLGYASGCSRLPATRSSDAVRFGVAHDHGSQLDVLFVHEIGHRPGEHGTLLYDTSRGEWLSSPLDLRIGKMAECYVQSYLSRRNRPILDSAPRANS